MKVLALIKQAEADLGKSGTFWLQEFIETARDLDGFCPKDWYGCPFPEEERCHWSFENIPTPGQQRDCWILWGQEQMEKKK